MQNKRYPVQYGLFMMAYYMTNAIYQGYMSLYYTSAGFNSAQMGAIFAVVALVSVFSQPLWGTLGDRVASRNRLLRMLAAASSLLALSFLTTRGFVPLLLLGGAFSCFYTSIQPMGDSIILAALDRRGAPFGPVRMSGGLMFALTSLIFGGILNAKGHETLAVWFTAGLCMLIVPATLALPDTPGYQSATGNRMSFGALFKDRALMKLMLFMLPVQITMGYFYTFFSPLFVGFPGGNSSLLGWCYFISALSEVPYLLLSDKLFDRFGAGKLMCVSALALTLRWLLVATAKSVPVLMLSQVLHGWGFIVMTVSMAKHITRNVPKELQASGQMLLAVVSFGLARAFGNLGGGLLAHAFGQQNVFYLTSAVCALAFLIFAPQFLKKKA